MPTLQQFQERKIGEFVEKGAVLEHERWARWQDFLHKCCIENPDGSLTIPAEKVLRWRRQINTHYDHLTDSEKESDRNETRNYLPLLLFALKEQVEEVGKMCEEMKKDWPLWGLDTSPAEGDTTKKKDFNEGYNSALSDLQSKLKA